MTLWGSSPYLRFRGDIYDQRQAQSSTIVEVGCTDVTLSHTMVALLANDDEGQRQLHHSGALMRTISAQQQKILESQGARAHLRIDTYIEDISALLLELRR